MIWSFVLSLAARPQLHCLHNVIFALARLRLLLGSRQEACCLFTDIYIRNYTRGSLWGRINICIGMHVYSIGNFTLDSQVAVMPPTDGVT
jgi:hypothetical protein